MNQPFTFAIRNQSTTDIKLVPQPDLQPPDTAWAQLEEALRSEDGVVNRSRDELYARWLRGDAAIAVEDTGNIVGHVALYPILAGLQRTRIEQWLLRRLPQPDVYVGITGWTHPNHRQQGIGLQLRQAFYTPNINHGRLIIGTALGLGGSPLVAKYGFTLIGWDQIPFVSSLEGWFDGHRYYIPGHGWQTFDHLTAYNGSSEPPPHHDWNAHAHFWVSDSTLAAQLNADLQHLLDDDLAHWRTIIQHTTS